MPASSDELSSYEDKLKAIGKPYLKTILGLGIIWSIAFTGWAVETVRASESGFSHDELVVVITSAGVVLLGFGIGLGIYMLWQHRLEKYRREAFKRWIQTTYNLDLPMKDVLLLRQGHMVAQGYQLVAYKKASESIPFPHLIDKVTGEEFIDPNKQLETRYSSLLNKLEN